MNIVLKSFLVIRAFFRELPEYIMRLSNAAISFLIIFMTVALIAYAASIAIEVYKGFSHYTPGNVLHDAALLIVIVKAYKVMLYYYKRHRVSIKYIVEISIIAPAIELIFAPGDGRSLWILVLFGVFGVANLIIYILFYEKLSKIDDKECLTNTDLDPQTVAQK